MEPQGIALDTAVIMSTVLESILYGFSALMFIGTIWAVTHKHRMQDGNRPITAVAILLFILSTTHMVVDIARMEDGLVEYNDTFVGGPLAFFADVSQPTYVIKSAIYTLQTLLGDGAVIYRCYVVWQSGWVIVLPGILWCSSAVTAISSVCNFSKLTWATDSGKFVQATGQLWLAFLASTLSTHLICSGLLVYRIWMIERNVSTIRAPKSTTRPILRVLVEDVLYSGALISIVICFVLLNNAQVVVLSMVVPITSICFYMVLIRIAINRKTHSYLPTIRRGITNETKRPHSRQYSINPLQVHISQFTDSVSTYEIGNQDRPSACKVKSVEEACCDV